MKGFVLFIGLCASLYAPSYGQTTTTNSQYTELATKYNEQISKAETFYNAKKYQESADAYTAAFGVLGGQGYMKDRYNAARSWSLVKNKDSAFFCLERIADKVYFDDVDKTMKEEDFTYLHNDARWEPLLATIKQNKENKLPEGWFRAGSKPNSYSMRVDKGAGKDKNDVLTIKSTDKLINGFGTIMQNFLLEKYLGKRVRMTGYMKTKDVDEWAGFWLRIDGKNKYKSLAFDNMKDGKTDRSVTGTTGWKKYEIVLDISEKANNIAFGALLSGTGQIWFDKIDFEVVTHKTETTGMDKEDNEPRNLQLSN